MKTKKMKLTKRLFSFLLILFLCIENFAAIISDNDGSAFVTKTEFEALKKDFVSQVDKYNVSIDNKIDGAIASYLAGARVSQQPNNLWEKVMISSANNFRWCSGPLPTSTKRGTGTDDLKDNISITGLRYHNHPEWRVFGTVRSHSPKGRYKADDESTWAPGVIYAVSWQAAAENGYAEDPAAHIERAYTNGAGSNLNQLTSWTNQYDFVSRRNSYARNIDLNNSWVTVKDVSIGQGKLYELNRLPNDNFELKSYYKKVYVDDQINIKCYTYKNFRSPNTLAAFNAIYTVPHGMDDFASGGSSIQTHEVNYNKGNKWNGAIVGEASNVNYNSTSAWNYATQNLSWVKESDGNDYSYRYWGTNVDQTLYAITDEVSPDWNAATEYTGFCNGSAASNYYTYQRDFYEYKGPNNEEVRIGNIKYKFYHPSVNPKTYTLKQIQNSYASKIASDILYHGNGAPLFYLYDKDAKYALKDIKLELYDEDNKLTSGSVKIMVSNNKFVDGNYANAATDKCWEKTVSIGSSGTITLDSDSFSVGNVNMIWVNIYPTDTTNFKMVKFVSVKPTIS